LSHLPVGTTVLISSQMPVGSVRRLEAIAAERFQKQEISFAYSPENLRLGKALDVFLKPDRIVVGVRSGRDREREGRRDGRGVSKAICEVSECIAVLRLV